MEKGREASGRPAAMRSRGSPSSRSPPRQGSCRWPAHHVCWGSMAPLMTTSSLEAASWKAGK